MRTHLLAAIGLVASLLAMPASAFVIGAPGNTDIASDSGRVILNGGILTDTATPIEYTVTALDDLRVTDITISINGDNAEAGLVTGTLVIDGGTPEVFDFATSTLEIIIPDFALSLGQVASFTFDYDAITPDTGFATDVSLTTTAIPLPAALPLMLAGLGGFAALRMRQRAA